jgi:RNA polymerase sigma-70 factor (ECF subfamily)
MTRNDQQHIDDIINGDHNAFSFLVDRYKNLVFSLALKMLKNREEAEEVSQDTFLKVFKSLDKFKGESKFSTWIYKVAYNTCLDRLKKNKREQHVVPIDEYTEHEVKTIDNALYALEQNERQQIIQKCIQALPSEDAF